MKNEKMCIITLNEKGKIESSENIEGCSLNDFAKDYLVATRLSNNIEIDETRNKNVYFKYVNSINDKIFMVNLYVLKSIKMNELIEDIREIQTELKYRNED